MDHPTSTWARQYGLPDPGIAADAVLASRPGQLQALAADGRMRAAALWDGSARARQAVGVLQEGWSTPAAMLAVQGTIRCAEATASACAASAEAIDRCAGALVGARSEVTRAYAAADDVIAAEGLLPQDVLVSYLGLFELFEKRRALVDSLYSTTGAILGRADDAAAALVAGIGPDPRPDVPAGWLAGAQAPARPTAEGIDAANRAALDADLASASPAHRAFAQHVRQSLRHAAETSGRAVELLDYDPDRPAGQGGAAIAIGDVSEADSVAVVVPGVGNSPSDMSGDLDIAAHLTSAAAAAAPDASTATIVWMGYDVPLSASSDAGPQSPLDAAADAAIAVNAVDASAGGAALATFCDRLRGAMDPSAGLTLIGHSYGSTVVSQAALRADSAARIDDIVLLASPGAGYGVSHASDYPTVPADHVYALAYPFDPVPNQLTDIAAGLANPLGGLMGLTTASDGTPFGPDPASAGYGAEVIVAPSNVPVRHDGPGLLGSLLGGPMLGLLDVAGGNPVHNIDQHALNNYLGGAALTAVAAITVGAYSKVPVRTRR